MIALVDLDLNCRLPSPEPAVVEEPRREMLRQEQSFPDQVKDLHKFYGSFWMQSTSAQSSLHSTQEHKLVREMVDFSPPLVQIHLANQRLLVPQMNSGLRAIENQEPFTNSNKRKSLFNVAEHNSDVRTSIRRKSDAYHGVIDLEKPATCGDALETVGCSGFGNLANQNGWSQDGSCCISPENSSLAEPAQLSRDWNSSRVSPGSVGSSDTPDCQSPIKTSYTISRRSLIDLNVPQEESLLVSSASFHSPSIYPRIFSKCPREVSEAVCGSASGSMRGSSVTVIPPNSVAESSRDVVGESSVQRKGLFDLNVSLESIGTPSEIICNSRDIDLNNDVSKGTAPDHSFSRKNSLQAETFRKYPILGNDGMLASKDDNGIDKVQSPESGTINNELLVPETAPVDNNIPPKLGMSHNGASRLQEVNMLQAKATDDDATASIAATTLLSIFQHSARTVDCPRIISQTAAENGNNEPQPSLNSFEKMVLDLEEIKDDGQSINVAPPDKDGPACGIKLKRGRGMRNFQREIIPGLVSLARQQICEDLQAIGYEPKKTRSRKTRKGQGASARSRTCKRGSAARN